MKVGQLMLFQNHPNLPQSDYEMYQNELDIALMAEPLGLDSVWAVEHHFTDYTLCPNIPQFLAFVAGQTKTIKLGTAAIILPWHKDPIRVATDIAMLDNMSNGRVLLGMGRGLAKIEYDGFGIDMAVGLGGHFVHCKAGKGGGGGIGAMGGFRHQDALAVFAARRDGGADRQQAA